MKATEIKSKVIQKDEIERNKLNTIIFGKFSKQEIFREFIDNITRANHLWTKKVSN